MEPVVLLLVALLILGFSLVARKLESSAVTPPMVFVLAGWGLSQTPWFTGISRPVLTVLLEVTLALVLFSDAARVDITVVRKRLHIPIRLLFIGLPLTVVAGVLAGRLVLGSWPVAVLAAVMLAPTDAALGEAVVHDKRVPAFVRQSLSVESGLNDGLAVPALAAAVAFALSMEQGIRGLGEAVSSIVIGVVFGLAAGAAGASVLKAASRHGWADEMGTRIATLGLALATFAGAESLGVSGFVAVFVAGLALGSRARSLCASLFMFTDNEGRLLTLLSFLAFGAVAIPVAVGNLSWAVGLYAVLSLTVIRMVPVALALIGSGLRPATVAMIGWFGPRGIASVVFVLLAAERLGEESAIAHETLTIVAVTVLLSVMAHGLSATTLAERYGNLMATASSDMPEMTDMADMEDTDG